MSAGQPTHRASAATRIRTITRTCDAGMPSAGTAGTWTVRPRRPMLPAIVSRKSPRSWAGGAAAGGGAARASPARRVT